MTRDVQDAIEIIAHSLAQVTADDVVWTQDVYFAEDVLCHAIRHLAYPDRDVYPKTRRTTKGAPIVRR